MIICALLKFDARIIKEERIKQLLDVFLYLGNILTVRENIMTRTLSGIALVFGLLFSISSIAEVGGTGSGTSVGFDYLKLSSTLDAGGVNLDFDTSALQVRFSTFINPSLDVEGDLAIGLSDDGYKVNDPFFGTVELKGQLSNMLGVFAKIHSDPMGSGMVYGKVGLARVSIELKGTIGGVSDSQTYDDAGLAYGVGGAFQVGPGGSIVLEYSVWPTVDIEGSDFDTTVLSIGYQINI